MFNWNMLYKLALYVGILGLGVWGTSLVLAPAMVHPLGSADAINPATSGTLGAALVGLAMILLFVAIQPRTVLLAVAIAFALVVVERAYLMFVTGDVLVNPFMLVILAISALVAVIILIKAFDPSA
jgi:hypothetical protein